MPGGKPTGGLIIIIGFGGIIGGIGIGGMPGRGGIPSGGTGNLGGNAPLEVLNCAAIKSKQND